MITKSVEWGIGRLDLAKLAIKEIAA